MNMEHGIDFQKEKGPLHFHCLFIKKKFNLWALIFIDFKDKNVISVSLVFFGRFYRFPFVIFFLFFSICFFPLSIESELGFYSKHYLLHVKFISILPFSSSSSSYELTEYG